MINAISTPLALPAGNSVILYQDPLPERILRVSSVIEVPIYRRNSRFDNAEDKKYGFQSYDRQAQKKYHEEKGVFIDSYL
jgi:hypothetical protein